MKETIPWWEADLPRAREVGMPVGDFREEREQMVTQVAARGIRDLWVLHAMGTTAGRPLVPPALLERLAVGGRLIMPVGSEPRFQYLVNMTRTGNEGAFVPLIGKQGWRDAESAPPPRGALAWE